MSERDEALIEGFLLQLAKRRGQVKVLEWGAGGSTIEFPYRLLDAGFRVSWLSVEHNDAFARHLGTRGRATGRALRVQSADQSDAASLCEAMDLSTVVVATLVLSQVKGSAPPWPSISQTDPYLQVPVDVGRSRRDSWDLVLVDGRFRRACLQVASGLIGCDGVVVLHDAWRSYYHRGFSYFKAGSLVGDELWVGSHRMSNVRQLVPPDAFSRHQSSDRFRRLSP